MSSLGEAERNRDKLIVERRESELRPTRWKVMGLAVRAGGSNRTDDPAVS